MACGGSEGRDRRRANLRRDFPLGWPARAYDRNAGIGGKTEGRELVADGEIDSADPAKRLSRFYGCLFDREMGDAQKKVGRQAEKGPPVPVESEMVQ